MSETIGAQLRQKRLDLCEAIAGLIDGFESETGVAVYKATVEFVDEMKDDGALSPIIKKRTVNVVCKF